MGRGCGDVIGRVVIKYEEWLFGMRSNEVAGRVSML